MTDKERILMHIIRELDFTMALARNPRGFNEDDSKDPPAFSSSRTYVHFAKYRKPVPGDLVLCSTMNMNDWKIGWFVRPIASDEALIREIGSDRVCRVYNEEFVPIVGLRKDQLLEGAEYEFYQKVIKAFRRGDEYNYRFGGVDFDSRDAMIWVREAFGGLGDLHRQSKPFGVPIHWNKKTTIKSILQAMIEGGYGTRKFEYEEIESG